MPPPDSKRQIEEPLHGMDYGVPPRYMLMANPALIELWNQGKCQGLGYMILPRHASFVDVPSVGIMFEDIEKGICVFNLLKSWDCEPGSGQGTDISFTENRAANSYTMALGPNIPEMIKRLLDPSMLEDYSLMTMGLTMGKTLTLSDHFRWLRDQEKTKPIVFAPANKSGEALLQHAFTKSGVQFFDHAVIPKDSIEYAMSEEEKTSRRSEGIKPLPVYPVEIATKRTRQLKKFFAVTIARLEHNPSFLKTVKHLIQNYERWQLVQAACNILCGDWYPELRNANGRLDFNKVYNVLRQHPEEITDELTLRRDFSVEVIEAQVNEDVIYLCDRLRPETKHENPVLTLRQLGVLR